MRNILEKIKPTLNKVLSFLLLIGIAVSIITLVNAAAPNPGHNFTESSGGLILGDLIYGFGTDTAAALAGNITVTKKFLNQTGNGSVSAAPVWSVLAAGDIPDISGTYSVKAGNTSLVTVGTLTAGALGTGFTAVADAQISSAATWNAKLTDPMTTIGDIIIRNASNITARLAGAAGFLKGGVSTAPAWSTINLAASADVGTSILPVANGGTNLNAAVSDAVLVGDSTSAYTARTLPASCAGTTAKLLYDSTTNLFSCGTDQTGGGSTMTTVTTKNASGLGTGANAAVAMTSLTARKVALFTIPYSITVNQLTYNVGAVTTAGTLRFCVYNETGTTKLIDVTDVPTAGANPIVVGAVTLTPGNYYIAFGCDTTCSNTVFMFTSTANTVVNTSAVPTGKKEYEGLYTMTSGTCNATIDPTAFTGTISHTVVVRLDN